MTATATLSLMTTVAHAESFNVINPVSMGMGGTGVALPNPATSSLFNPAELSATPREDRNGFNFGYSVGAEAYDPHRIIQKVNDTRKTLNKLQDEINSLNSSSSSSQYKTIAKNISDVRSNLKLMNDHSIAATLGTNILMNHAGHSLGVGLTLSGTADFASQTDYTAHDENYLNQMQTAANTSDYTTLKSFNKSNLTSNVRAVGVGILQAGLSLSHRFNVFGQSLDIGVTPKVMDVYTYNYSQTPANASTSEWRNSQYRNHRTTANVDFGVLKHFHNGLYTGLTVHNIVPENFKTEPDNQGRVETVKIHPVARVGVGYDAGWYRLGLDADLTRNQPLPLVRATRFVSVGGAINAWRWLQLRAGYRWDTLDSSRNVVSAGFGLSPFNVLHIDVGGLYAKSDYGASVQLGISI